MTTIAYRDGSIASDRRVTSKGKCYAGTERKIARTKSGWLFGGCGRAKDIVRFSLAFHKWNCRYVFEPPEGDYEAIVVSPDGQLYAAEAGAMWAYEAPFAAIGSGMATALGALYHGATAAEAVAIAALVDTSTGNGVDTLSLT